MTKDPFSPYFGITGITSATDMKTVCGTLRPAGKKLVVAVPLKCDRSGIIVPNTLSEADIKLALGAATRHATPLIDFSGSSDYLVLLRCLELFRQRSRGFILNARGLEIRTLREYHRSFDTHGQGTVILRIGNDALEDHGRSLTHFKIWLRNFGGLIDGVIVSITRDGGVFDADYAAEYLRAIAASRRLSGVSIGIGGLTLNHMPYFRKLEELMPRIQLNPVFQRGKGHTRLDLEKTQGALSKREPVVA